MATLTEAQDAYDRHNLHVGVIHSDVADVIIRLEAELDAARAVVMACVTVRRLMPFRVRAMMDAYDEVVKDT